MVQVSVKQATETIIKNYSQLDEKAIVNAIRNAINRTLMKGRTVARKSVKEQYNIPQRYMDRVDKVNATRKNLTGYIVASSVPLPMDAFNPKFETQKSVLSITRRGEQKQTRKKKGDAAKGVSIEVHKGKRETIPFAFMIAGAKPRVFARGQYRSGGGYGFIQRHKRVNKKGSDNPIKPLLSVTVHAAVINKQVEKKIAVEVEQYYPKRLVHELDYQVSKMKSMTK